MLSGVWADSDESEATGGTDMLGVPGSDSGYGYESASSPNPDDYEVTRGYDIPGSGGYGEDEYSTAGATGIDPTFKLSDLAPFMPTNLPMVLRDPLNPASWRFNAGGPSGVTAEGGKDVGDPTFSLNAPALPAGDIAPSGRILPRGWKWTHVMALVKRYGPQALAAVLSTDLATALKLYFLGLRRGGGRRRSRGVSGRDIRNARRTIRVLRGFEHQLGGFARGGRKFAARRRRRR